LIGFSPFRRFQPSGGFSGVLACVVLTISPGLFTQAFAQSPDTLPTPAELKKMSLEELMDINVTIVSKRPERLTEAPSSIQVITQDDLKRFGVFTLPEALRLATNLQVAQVDARQWAISARGQNSILSNKLLVMIDGRSIYTPLYAGVFWDVQNIILDNVERIEVISGPGGTLWGANAVNGVINIVTKGAEFSQGGLVGAAVGTSMQGLAAARSGGKFSKDGYYRLWGRWLAHNSTELIDGSDGKNPWDMLQGGFQTDWIPKAGDRLTVSGNAYKSDLDQDLPAPTHADGQNIMVRWTRAFSDLSGIQAQAYFDRSMRLIRDRFREDLDSYDFDFQHHLPLGDRNALLWGGGYRLMQDEVGNSTAIAFLPADRALNLFSGFLQDDMILIKDWLKFTLGTKLEHNDYSGFEWMPSGRLSLTPDDHHTLWAALSRAVRSPSRIDVDVYLPGPPVAATTPQLQGGPDFKSEKLTAVELGFRARPAENLTLSIATFYDWYEDLRVLENSVDSTHYVFNNGKLGEVEGVELSSGCQVASWWQLKAGYTYLNEKFWDKPGHVETASPGSQGNDPHHQYMIQSMMDLPKGFTLNGTVRYVSSLPHPEIPSYATFDLSSSWQFHAVTLTVVAHDLAEENHREFASDTQQNQVPRSVSGRVGWRF
jgi:iron complex outermembrane recepter protein